ncbi:MAG: class D sortase [bacterium]|nr:class D sortase [bacterium]
MFAGRPIWDMVLNEFKLAAVKGAPEYSYEKQQSLDNDHTEPREEIEKGEENPPLIGTMFGEVCCETAELKAPLYYGDSDDIFEKGIGIYAASSLPGETGTILAGGHDTTFMAPLEHMEKGNEIIIKTVNGQYQYEVTDIKIADVLDQDAYGLQTDQEQLVLYTCYPFGDVTKQRTERFYVYAKRVNVTNDREVG